MGLFIIAILFFVLFALLMAVGVIFKRKPISGSCGGLNTAMQDSSGKCLSCGMKVDTKMQENLSNRLK